MADVPTAVDAQALLFDVIRRREELNALRPHRDDRKGSGVTQNAPPAGAPKP